MGNTQRLPGQRCGVHPTARGLILAAHGSHHDAEVNEAVQTIAATVRSGAVGAVAAFDEVVACFHQGKPAFCDVLDGMAAGDVTVVPLMTSEGYFAGEVLPSALRQNRRFDEVVVNITPVLGSHAAIPRMLAQHVHARCLENSVQPVEASVVVVGHGTRRNAQSRAQTIQSAQAVGQLGPWTRTAYAFIDDDPTVAAALQRCRGGAVVVAPFLISAGPHARRLPHQLGLDPSGSVALPFVGRRAEGPVIVDEPLLCYPALPGLVLDLARATAHRLRAGSI